MIEPNYDSLSRQQLEQLCYERRIPYDLTTLTVDLVVKLIDRDIEKSVSQLNPE